MFLTQILGPFLLTLMFTFPFLSHPLSMGLNLLIITILGATILSIFTTSTWVSYAIILVLLGGLLVIFIYVALLASNEIFIPNPKTTLFMIVILSSCSLILVLNTKEINLMNPNFLPSMNLTNDKIEWITHLYSMELSNLTIFLILYLLLTLIVVVYNTKNNFTSLRSFSN